MGKKEKAKRKPEKNSGLYGIITMEIKIYYWLLVFLKWLLNWRLQVHKLCIRLVENLSLNYEKI